MGNSIKNKLTRIWSELRASSFQLSSTSCLNGFTSHSLQRIQLPLTPNRKRNLWKNQSTRISPLKMRKQMRTLLLRKLRAATRRKPNERLAPPSPGPASQAVSGFGMSRQNQVDSLLLEASWNESHF